ncbi:MAG TPA: 16S rRNA (cytidine(1402)-2'-O)-methyltransferase [Candidatus Limnocylindria bacterium]|nr:16S rRNA (cytidine(1402)-2'-O)-methyltransferase [Candidatus Limnocylindria bacterium]
MAGRLLVVGTPIGNLGDLTPRAAEALRTADLVVAEDTRLAGRLLAHLGAKRPTVSFNDHSPPARLGDLLARLARGETLALTTDAGMPGVSDPGARLVAAVRDAGIAVEVLPGPSAVTAAIAVSGIESLGFLFGGFLPARPAAARTRALERLLDASGATALPLVLFEAPHRIGALLRALDGLVPQARVAACRELTKLHEEVLIGTPAEVLSRLADPRGELTLVISGIPRPDAAEALDVAALVDAAQDASLSPRTTVELLRAMGVPRRVAYRAVPARDPRKAAKPPLTGR